MAADLNKKSFPFGGPMTRGRLSIVTLTLGRFVTIGWQLKHPNNKIRGGVGGGESSLRPLETSMIRNRLRLGNATRTAKENNRNIILPYLDFPPSPALTLAVVIAALAHQWRLLTVVCDSSPMQEV